MSYDYSENRMIQDSAGHLLEQELGWDIAFAYNTEQLGKDGTFGRTSYREILLTRYFRQALQRLNPSLYCLPHADQRGEVCPHQGRYSRHGAAPRRQNRGEESGGHRFSTSQ